MTELRQEQSEPKALSENMKRIAEAVGEVEAQPQAAAPDETVQTEDPEVELDFGEGVKRKVSAKELAQIYRTREELETQRKAAETLLSRSATLKQLHDQIESFSDEDKQTVLDVFTNPRKYAAQRQDDYSDYSEYPTERPSVDPVVARRIAQLEAQIGQMSQERARSQLTERVNRAIESTNMLSSETLSRNPHLKGLRDLAYKQMVYEASSNPGADLDALAIKLDMDTARALKAGSIRPESPDVRGRKEVLGFAPEKPMTASDLKDGSIARRIQERLASLGGG